MARIRGHIGDRGLYAIERLGVVAAIGQPERALEFGTDLPRAFVELARPRRIARPRDVGQRAIRRVRVPLDLDGGDRTRRAVSVRADETVVRVLPHLVLDAVRGAALILDEAVAIEVAA